MNSDETDHLLQKIRDHLGRIADSLAILVTYARPEPAPPTALPSRYARVHLMGRDFLVGEVEAIERGGYRIRYLDSDIKSSDFSDLAAAYRERDTNNFAKVRTKDIRAIHSVDWLDEPEYRTLAADIENTAKLNLEYMYRDTCFPEGYEHVRRVGKDRQRHGFRRLADGRVHGFEGSEREAQQSAWEDSTGSLTDWPDRRAELNLPPPPTKLRWWCGDVYKRCWEVPAVGQHLVVDERADSGIRVHVLVRNTPEGIFITDQGCGAFLTHDGADVPLGIDGSRTAQVEKGDTFAVGANLLVFDDKPLF